MFGRTCVAALAVAAALLAPPAVADGGMSVEKARAACEKRGGASDPKKLQACCDNLISPQADYAAEKRMIRECVSGKPAPRAAEKPGSRS